MPKNYIKYHKDGTVWAKGGRMINGKPDGFFKWFRKDGSLMRSGYFKKGKQVGKWTTYDKNGKVIRVTNFD